MIFLIQPTPSRSFRFNQKSVDTFGMFMYQLYLQGNSELQKSEHKNTEATRVMIVINAKRQCILHVLYITWYHLFCYIRTGTRTYEIKLRDITYADHSNCVR